MATPQYTIKVGADSVDYFAREVTASDVGAGKYKESQIGLIMDSVLSNSDEFKYPVVVRRTGDSFKGSTESIESNELRAGRTKSAPRKGNSSAEGSLEFELSPETYDDILEAALRGKWTKWISDTESLTNIVAAGEVKPVFKDGTFLSKVTNLSTREIKSVHKRLWANKNELEVIKAKVIADGYDNSTPDKAYYLHPDYPLIVTDADVEVSELTCGTNDVKYSVLKHFGGVENDDLFQEFQHMAVNTMSLSVSPGQIVTGSFGFMGGNNPDVVQKGVDKDGKIEYEADGKTPKGLLKLLSKYTGHDSRFANEKTPEEVKEWIKELPKKGTSTDQYTAREGFLYVNGERVRYGSNLTFELNNGLTKTFAIFEKDAIATSPLTLDITGNLGAYLIKGYSENLYNLATQDKDVELVFCFQEKEDNPESLYVVQIFKSKFTDTDLSSGAENLEVTFPYQSFEERAVRIFRLEKRKGDINTDATGNITFTLAEKLEEAPVSEDFELTVNGTKLEAGTDYEFTYDSDEGVVTFEMLSPLTYSNEGNTVTILYNRKVITETGIAKIGVTEDGITLDATDYDDVSVTLTSAPDTEPVFTDFDVALLVDGNSVEVDSSNYTYSAGTANFGFTAISQTDKDQSVVFSVTYNGTTATKSWIIPAL